MTDKKEKASNLQTIKNVVFAYTSVTRAQKQLNKDNKPALSDDPLEFHAWEIKILISASRFKNLKKAFKGAKNFPNVKEYTPEECVSKNLMKEEPDEDQVLIKFSQGCLFGPKGNRKPARPVRQIGVKGGVQDRNGQAVTQETAIGNGTKGHLQFNPVENEFGLYLYPTAICITDLIEYVSEGGSFDADAFDLEELDEVDEDDFNKDSDSDDEDGDDDDGFNDPSF